MKSIELLELSEKINLIQNENLKNYLALKDSKDIALDRIIGMFNQNEALISKAIDILKEVSL